MEVNRTTPLDLPQPVLSLLLLIRLRCLEHIRFDQSSNHLSFCLPQFERRQAHDHPPRNSTQAMSNNNPPRSSSSTAPAPPPSSEIDDVTWLDFLRAASGPTSNPPPADRSTSADRKRRHTGSEPERRGYPYPHYNAPRRPSGMTLQTQTQRGGSAANPVDLTTPPRPRPLMAPPRVSSGEGRRGGLIGSTRERYPERSDSDIVLPHWQADAEVNACPVCQAEFSFWYRKHHCRKCGRVVCAACSPHRITIPRQYIVQQPSISLESEQQSSTPTSPTTSSSYARNLGGGEVVRVCNPCVPDPWTPDTASDGQVTRPSLADGTTRRRESADNAERRDRLRFNPLLPPPPPQPFTQEAGRARSRSHQPPPTSHSNPRTSAFAFRDHDLLNRAPPPPPPSSRPHRYTQSANSTTHPPPFPLNARPPHPPSSTSVPAPRREIPEEDECPVCGTELPPGPALRETHVQECIALRFGMGTPPQPPITNPASSIPPHGSTGPSTPQQQQRPRATSYRPRGMALYRATEKDCASADGEAQECVICFEEFQAGEEMGRMECLCRFHRGCIRRWWDMRGSGSCPTHMLHE